MILKVSDPARGEGFRLIEVSDVTFGRCDGATFADVVTGAGPDRVVFRGTAYVLNAQGDTIEKFSERQERKA